MNINDLTITELHSIMCFDLSSEAHLFTLDELQTAKIANTQDKQDITGRGGRKLNSLKRNKAVVVSGTNGLVSAGMLAVQTGSEFVSKDSTPVKIADILTVSNGTAITSFKAVGTAGNEIERVYVRNEDGSRGKELIQNDTVGEGKFTYNPDTKTITVFTDDVKDGTEIIVYYFRNVAGAVVENISDVYSTKCKMYIDAWAEDACGNGYRVQFYIPKADFSGNFDIDLGDNQTVHAFEAESLSGACGKAGLLWSYTVYGADAEDAA